MSQVWTIIFAILLLIGWGVACWHDREEQRRQRRRDAVSENRGESAE